MSTTLKLVQSDTLPEIAVRLYDEQSDDFGNITEVPIDLSDVASVALYFRKKGQTALTDTLSGQVVPPATDGVLKFQFTALSLAGDAGSYEGEIELTMSGGGKFTVYETIDFKVRAQFA